MEQQLLDYIIKARSAGESDTATRTLLIKNGWTQAEVDEAFFEIDQPELAVKVPDKTISKLEANAFNQPTSNTDYINDNNNNINNSNNKKSMNKIILVLIVIFLCAGFFTGGVFLKNYLDQQNNKNTAESPTVQARLDGEINKIDGNKLTILTLDEENSLVVNSVLIKEDATISFVELGGEESMPATINDIKAGQLVTLFVSQKDNGDLETSYIIIIE